jgi:hypothetical protein
VASSVDSGKSWRLDKVQLVKKIGFETAMQNWPLLAVSGVNSESG